MLVGLFAIVLTLILVVGIHEIGHAVTARYFGVTIRRISLGFGKPLVTWKDKTGREWTWALFPLGGYVHLLNSRIEPVPESEFKHCFDKKPIWQRCLILLAGALANLLTAFLALTFMYMIGYQQQAPVIEAISTQSLADRAGIQVNERFIAIAGQPTPSWEAVGMNLVMAVTKPQVPILLRDQAGLLHAVKLDLSQWPYKKGDRSLLAAIGIKPDSSDIYREEVAGQSFLKASSSAFTKLLFLLKFFLVMIKQILLRAIPFSILLGPLGLFASSIHSFYQGIAVFLYFIASLSLSVGLVNLFPIPGLDGGLLLYALIEKWRAKPLSVAMELLLHRFAFIFFALLLFQLLMNDLQRYFQ